MIIIVFLSPCSIFNIGSCRLCLDLWFMNGFVRGQEKRKNLWRKFSLHNSFSFPSFSFLSIVYSTDPIPKHWILCGRFWSKLGLFESFQQNVEIRVLWCINVFPNSGWWSAHEAAILRKQRWYSPDDNLMIWWTRKMSSIKKLLVVSYWRS